jgi:Fic family protein
MSGREVPITWNGRRVRAWVPDPLAEQDLKLSETTARRTEQAAALIRRGSDELPPAWEVLARLLLRAEGVASSFIEGVRAPLADVAAAELDPSVGEAATWVAGNLSAVTEAIEAASLGPLTIDQLQAWHRVLMAGTRLLPAPLIGAFRDVQGWIGGTSPTDAALVTPPPEEVGALMDDLVVFANRTDIDPVTQAAAAHAQFEIVHPYADGNGRIGRVLVSWILTRRLNLVSPPPLSVRIALDRGGYLSGLTLFRLGDLDRWVAWFADVVAEAGEASIALVRAVTALQASWLERLAGARADAAARRVVALLPEHPVLTASVIAASLGVSERTGRSALEALAERAIVEPFAPAHRGPGRPRRWWVATELISLVEGWSR